MAHYTQIIELNDTDSINEYHDAPAEELTPPTEYTVFAMPYQTPGAEKGLRPSEPTKNVPPVVMQMPTVSVQEPTHTAQASVYEAPYRAPHNPYALNNGALLANEPTGAMVKYTPDFRADPLFLDALQHLQQGAWSQGTLLLNVLKAKYPSATELDFLVQDAALRAEIENSWGAKVKGRQFSFAPMHLLTRIVPLVIIAMLVVGGLFAYGYAQRVRAASLERRTLQEQAQAAFQAGDYTEAIALFNKFLTLVPGDATALKSIEEAQKQIALQKDYKLAVDAMNAGDNVLALKYFADIEAKAPGYLDVKALVEKIKGTANIAQVFATAETSYQGKQWTKAIQAYEALRQLNSSYQSDVVTPHLMDAYLQAGQQIVTQAPAADADPNMAKDYFGKVLKLNPTNATAQAELDLLNNDLKGMSLLQQDAMEQAIPMLQAVYDERPAYLGGFVAEQLYQSYMKLGHSGQQSGNLWYALTQYSAASALKVKDNSEALRLINEVTIALTPTATPQPTTAPLPTATPIPPKLSDFVGWLIFKTDRDGGLWVMKPDGSNAQPAPADAQAQLASLYEKESWSPDHNSHLYVEKTANNSNGANIYKLRADLPANWQRVSQYTDMPGDEYDPVWAVDNKHIAFVANGTGNDEIWTMDSDGNNQKQLTHNTWEWDKHPTWSPDGQKIVFYSNRTGKRQLWIMNADGSAQTQLSDGQAEEWDPIWLK